MKTWSLALLAAAAALSLQACDVTVHDASKEQASSSVSEPAPAPAPADTTSVASSEAPQPATQPAAEAPAAGASAPSDTTMSAPQQPGTSEMGGPAMGTGSMPTDNVAAGVAAPTELERFLQEHPIRARSGEGATAKQ
ncbi:hypothetical protein H8N03_09960 [Ramlibacter sp. USB13]|uniref:Uncharacterized protein n=1 Tax=Ramlibacter cellulosilyticus TaxID=2764187 RepID=A0A923MRI5_9BURK|nr:hypothetical protein [Ramlibacter cellulosilyticus]MBC5783269.1 hypothetical protein [Ramlibacter cellulosilyticus]